MIEQYDFVVFLDADWGTTSRKNRQHFLVAALAHRLEGKCNFLAVERPVCPVTDPFRKRTRFLDWLRRRRGLRREGANLFVCTPFVWLHNVLAARVPGLTRANRWILGLQIGQLTRRLGLRRGGLVAWIHHPYQMEDMGLAREQFLIYDCYDNYFSAARGRRLADLRRREAAILGRAHLVLVTSEQLQQAMASRARRAHLLPNGVDVELFAQAMRSSTQVPADLCGLPRPVVGFVGRITPRVDFALLAGIASRHPDWTFVMLGPEDSDGPLAGEAGYLDLRSAANVHFLGPRPYEQLPAYLKGFDVCTIPYVLTEFNLGSCPLKLFEYMAAGKPIVSVDIPQVAHFEPLVRVAKTAAQFDGAIADSLDADPESVRRKSLALVGRNSWQRRARSVTDAIQGALQEDQR